MWVSWFELFCGRSLTKYRTLADCASVFGVLRTGYQKISIIPLPHSKCTASLSIPKNKIHILSQIFKIFIKNQTIIYLMEIESGDGVWRRRGA